MRDFVQVLRTGLIALMTTAGLVSVSPGQVFLPSPDSAGNLTLPVDPDLSAALAVAQHEIAAENWVRAANVLQLILDVDEDAFVSPFESPRSVRRSASQLLVEMPLAGRQQYERLYGPAAESLWRQVESDGNLEAHSELLRRFLHTTVGRQAAWRMAVMRQDQGASLSAALLLEQLVVDPSSASLFGAELELRAALAWQAAGRSERAATHLDAIAERNIESVELLGTTLTIPGDSAARSEWLAGLAGAVVDRSAALSGAGVAPFLPPRDAADWHVPAVCEDDLLAMYPDRAQKLNGVLETMQQLQREQSQENGRLLIPAPRPLVLPDRLLVRGPDRLQCLSAADGAPQWIAATVDYTFRELAEQSDFSSRDDLTRELYLGQRAWCDGTSAVMACDDSRAYTVVDCGMIGAVDSIVAMQSRRHGKGAFRDNTLQAFDLRGGRQLWSIGGPPVAGNETDPFGGLFFLGAPTLHEGRLYCLVEDRGQVRLLVLDPSTEVRPTLLWTQSLLNTPPLMDVLQHEIRRTTPLSPVIQGQVVICPTGSGSVVAVDLVARQLLWTSTYQTVTPEIRRRGRMRPVQALAMQQQVALDRLLDAPRWRQSFSIWQQDRALFTIPDSDSLLCVRASDGERLWELSRENWQYVAAVDAIKVTLVGDSEIDAVRLSDGEPAWEQPTPIPPPSGAGFEHDGLYTLPLSTGEVATIDLNTGRLLARSPLVEDVLPGNLTAASGRLVSQSATGVRAFPSLLQHPELLAAETNPKELTAAQRALRGEHRLHSGDLEGGLADLRAASEGGDPRIRRVLAATLVEGLRMDFPRHRSDAPEIDSLVTGTADEASFRRLYASQLQKHGDSVAAFVQLLRLGEVTRSGSEMEAIDAEHSVGRDRWIEARVHELLASASVADREAMLNGLRDRLHAVVDAADDDARLRALQGLVRMARGTPLEVDALTALARSAEGLPLLQQSWLWQSIQAVGDESLQAEAVARLAQLTMRSHDPVSAVPYVDLLRTTYAEVPCLDQQTGRQLLDDWSRDAQFEEALSEATASAWPGRDVAITNRPFDDQIPRVHVLPVIGEIEGPLAGWSFTYDDRQHRLYAHNPLGRIAWEVSLSTESASERSIPTGVMAVGHLVMVRWENRFQLVAALTSEGGRYRTVSGGRSLISQMYQTQPFAGRRLHDSTGRAVGLVGPLTSEVVCYGVDESLVGLDPWTGREVWRRAYAGGINAIFGDDDYVVIRPNGQGELIVLRAVDGSLVARRPWPADFLSPPVGADWGRLLPTLKSINDSSDRLAMYDSATGETLWERQCSSPIHWSTVDGGSILLVDGKFQCVLLDPSTGQELFSVPLPIEPPEDDRWDSLTVASDRDRVYVVMNRPQDSRVLRFERQATGDRPVNGRLCAVNRATGKLAWHADVDGQYIDPNHPDAWPVLILAARQRAADAEGFEFVEHILDKQTGELIHESQMPDEALGNRWVAQVRWRVAGEPPVIRMIHGPQTLEIAPGADKESDQ